MNTDILNKLECILKDLSPLEKKGLDTSSLKVFVKKLQKLPKNQQAVC